MHKDTASIVRIMIAGMQTSLDGLFIFIFLKLNQNPATYVSCCKRTLSVRSLKILVIE